ncbi:MAG: hypothetical protein Q4A01_02180 [Coriobacteriales bacterium]|nr:hypothetical protein [Coriobacteriales bacterium]
MRSSFYNKVGAGFVTVAMAVSLVLGGCAFWLKPHTPVSTSDPTPVPIESTTTDQMFTDSASGEIFDVVMLGDEAIRVTNGEQLDMVTTPDMQDGHFYRVVADVEYLSGGVAGYDRYPDIQDVVSVTEVSPNEVDVPTFDERRFGFVKIGDYADGDYLYTSYYDAAVLKDGKWVYTYTKEYDRPDGSNVRHVADVSKEKIEEGIDGGVVCCEDYFLIPPKSES